MHLIKALLSCGLMLSSSTAFAPTPARTASITSTFSPASAFAFTHSHSTIQQQPAAQNREQSTLTHTTTSTSIGATPDLEVVALVAGQENYGFAIVAMGEAIWSFLEAPSFDHAKVLVPATVAAIILCFVSGPMVTNASDPAAIKLGLEIATGVSVMLGASYVARMLSPYSPSAKEIAFGGLLVAIAGFFSFSQNLVVDEFVQLPSIPLPELPSIFPENDF